MYVFEKRSLFQLLSNHGTPSESAYMKTPYLDCADKRKIEIQVISPSCPNTPYKVSSKLISLLIRCSRWTPRSPYCPKCSQLVVFGISSKVKIQYCAQSSVYIKQIIIYIHVPWYKIAKHRKFLTLWCECTTEQVTHWRSQKNEIAMYACWKWFLTELCRAAQFFFLS